MTDPNDDVEPPDPVETDPAALNSAEDLDEDRLQVDPLERGMDPPEHWSAADRRGTTPWEQAHAPQLDERLAEEEPDMPERDDSAADTDDPERMGDTSVVEHMDPVDEDPPVDSTSYEESLGTSADVAGGSMADQIRRPQAN